MVGRCVEAGSLAVKKETGFQLIAVGSLRTRLAVNRRRSAANPSQNAHGSPILPSPSSTRLRSRPHARALPPTFSPQFEKCHHHQTVSICNPSPLCCAVRPPRSMADIFEERGQREVSQKGEAGNAVKMLSRPKGSIILSIEETFCQATVLRLHAKPAYQSSTAVLSYAIQIVAKLCNRNDSLNIYTLPACIFHIPETSNPGTHPPMSCLRCPGSWR